MQRYPDSQASGEEASYPPQNSILAFWTFGLGSLGLGNRVGLSPSSPAGKILAMSLLMTSDARFSRNFFLKIFSLFDLWPYQQQLSFC